MFNLSALLFSSADIYQQGYHRPQHGSSLACLLWWNAVRASEITWHTAAMSELPLKPVFLFWLSAPRGLNIIETSAWMVLEEEETHFISTYSRDRWLFSGLVSVQCDIEQLTQAAAHRLCHFHRGFLWAQTLALWEPIAFCCHFKVLYWRIYRITVAFSFIKNVLSQKRKGVTNYNLCLYQSNLRIVSMQRPLVWKPIELLLKKKRPLNNWTLALFVFQYWTVLEKGMHFRNVWHEIRPLKNCTSHKMCTSVWGTNIWGKSILKCFKLQRPQRK